MKHTLRTIAALVIFGAVPFAGAQTQVNKLSEAEIKARTDKRHALQWYVIEPMAPCIAGSSQRIREQGEDPIDVRYGRHKFRLEQATFEELTGLDPKFTGDLDPNLKAYLKGTIVADLAHAYKKGACKEDN
jgi:hypothetical protein